VPAKRRKIPPKLRDQRIPIWAQDLLAGKLPERDSDDWNTYVSWVYFSESIVGLPASSTPEGKAVWAKANGLRP
jgi:hypothetical protein